MTIKGLLKLEYKNDEILSSHHKDFKKYVMTNEIVSIKRELQRFLFNFFSKHST